MTGSKGYRPKGPDGLEGVMAWIETHTREVMWLALAVVAAAGGVWFYFKSQAAQARNAANALVEAEQAVASQNMPLAQANLERLVKRYPDMEPGKVGMVLLAQVHYQKGEFQAGIEAIKPLTKADDPFFTAQALGLTGAGYEQLHKYAEAAASYRSAAEKARFESDKAIYLSSAARNLVAAGQVNDAKGIYASLASDPNGPAAAEARVRLGELNARN